MKIRRMLRSIVVCFCVSLLILAPTASADMRGVDVSNWQCNIDVGRLDADFVVAGVTWGVGGFNNVCLRNGVSQVADYQLVRATATGKSIGVYHYAMGNDARREADFFVNRVTGYVGRAVLALDWERDDNPQFGNGKWVESWVRRVYERTHVWPIIYIPASALGQLTRYVRRHCGVWVAQYATSAVSGWQSRPWRYGAYGEAMRQYTGNGRVTGYAGALDLNYFRGARWQWDAYAVGDRKGVYKGDGSMTDNGAYGTPPAISRCVVVTRGDTLSGIAARTGLNPWSAWGGYKSGRPELIYPGETVCYRGKPTVQTSVTRTHVVVSGESLWGIFGTDWSRVAKINGLSKPYVIYPGQLLRY